MSWFTFAIVSILCCGPLTCFLLAMPLHGTYGKLYTFHSFLGLNSTHHLCNLNLTTSFVLMLLIIILTGDIIEYDHDASMCIKFHMYMTMSEQTAHFIVFWVSILYSLKFQLHLVIGLINIIQVHI